MKINRSGLFWGLLLIGAGVVALGQQMGYINQFTEPRIWIAVFAVVSLLAFLNYALSGWKQWGWLFPAGVISTFAVIAALAIAGLINEDGGPGSFVSAGFVNALLMGGLAATFAVVWLRHSKDWARIVTIILAVLAVASVFFFNYYDIFWPLAFILGGLYLFYTALRPRTA